MDEVEKPAEFPGGNDAWVNFLKKNLKVPGQLEENTSKTVEAGFYVTQDGRIENIEIMKSGGKEYDKEVLRVLSLMPRWKPRQKGRLLVGVNVKQPITFKNEGIEL
ncbi:MAG TPA: TonB family protein [Flavisolibacter sp.]|nr:TonB family protein [Flavisolibacter sp.]